MFACHLIVFITFHVHVCSFEVELARSVPGLQGMPGRGDALPGGD